MPEREVKYFRLVFNNNSSYYICNFTKDDSNWYHGTAHSLQGNKRYLITRYVEKEPLPGCTVTELLTHSDDRIKYISQDRVGTTNYDVEIRSDAEGGNITLRSQNKSQVWEIDAFDNNALRILNLVKGGYLLIKNDGSLENTTITDLYNKYNSFNSTKSSITGSTLGVALGMTSNSNWNDVVSKIVNTTNYTGNIVKWAAGDWTVSAGWCGFKPDILFFRGNVTGTQFPIGIYCNVNGMYINVVEGQSQSHYGDVIVINDTGWTFNKTMAYVDGRAIRYVALKITP